METETLVGMKSVERPDPPVAGKLELCSIRGNESCPTWSIHFSPVGCARCGCHLGIQIQAVWSSGETNPRP